MGTFRRATLWLEALEQRDCPSLTVTFFNSTLSVSGTPRSGAGAGVFFTQVANNRWQLHDGTSNLGTYNATNVSLSVTEHQMLPIVFDLGGFTSTGNISVNLGAGDTSGSSTNGLTVFDGQLNGNLSVLNGSGEEEIQLGYRPLGHGAATVENLTVGGNVTINAKENPNLSVGGQPNGDIFDTGTELPPTFTGPTVLIGGTLTTTGVNAVQLSQTTTVGKDVNVSTVRDQQDVTGVGDLLFGTVDGNVSIRGASTSRRDIIQIGDGTDAASIGGTLSVTLGNGSNELFAIGPLTVVGNAYIQMGDGNNYLSLDGTYFSNLSVNLGNGNNTDGTTAPDSPTGGLLPFFPATASVSDNFTLTAGSGANNFTPAGSGGFAGAVGETTSITLGDGANAEFVVSSGSLGGQFIWKSGNGGDALTFAGAPNPVSYDVNIQFGNLNDTLTFNDPSGSIFSGRADGGGGTNTLVQGPGNDLNNVQISNFS